MTAMSPDAHNSLRKRNAALELVEHFRRTLPTLRVHAEVHQLTGRARQLALDLQGTDSDRPYLARTISQFATALRRAGWTDVCVELLEWALHAHIEDSFLYTELVMCHLGRDDGAAAEQVLVRAESTGMVGEAMYAALIAACGRAKRCADAQRLFDRAGRAGVSGHYTCTALIDTYVRAGDLARARLVFTAAQSVGRLDAGAFSVLVRGYIRAGCAGEIARLGRQADEAGLMTDGMRTTITQVLHRAGRTRQANRFRRKARSRIAP